MRIFLVEDDERIVRFMKRGLEAECHEIEVAKDRQQVFDQIHAQAHDIIIIDVFLDEDDGLEICQDLRQRRIATPILILTDRDSVDMNAGTLSACSDGYLVKPFSFEDLLAKIYILTFKNDLSTPKDGVADSYDRLLR